jgi:hypothetical protein
MLPSFYSIKIKKILRRTSVTPQVVSPATATHEGKNKALIIWGNLKEKETVPQLEVVIIHSQ